ncbi:alpha/beta hydrolase [Frondihabitans cladoniiphilus]|uniref:DUF1023 domain-containing protein n=1 Tax=Frondihabitans cladoniiphilus TaxID=715785 RepID=A0ABP8WCM4_9MICO
MADWTTTDPGAGDLEPLQTRMTKLQKQLDHALDLKNLVGTQDARVDAAWTGTGHAAWARKAAEAEVAWNTLHTWAQNEYSALGRYVATVQDIKERAAKAKGRLASAEQVLAAPHSMLADPTLTGTTDSTDATASGLDLTARSQASSDRLAAQFALQKLAEERQAADSALVSSIHDARLDARAAGLVALPGGLTVSGLDSMSTTDLLTTLGSLSATDLNDVLEADPSLAQTFWKKPPPAAQVASWWSTLSDEQKAALTAGASSIIGNLGGVPYSIRLEANRLQLRDAQARTDLTKEQRTAVEQTAKALKARKSVPPAPRGLLDFTLESDPPLAAVVIGDLDTAGHVTWAVPGMDTKVSTAMAGWTGAAQNLYDQQRSIDPSESLAVVSWIGYKTPTLAETEHSPAGADSVLTSGLAYDGGTRLASELDALHDTRANGGQGIPQVSALGHSYGTTTVADALVQTKHDVTNVELLASAGIDSDQVPTTGSMHVDTVGGAPQIYATQSVHDSVATLGRVGSLRWNPDGPLADTIRYGSSGTQVDGTYYKPVTGHDPIGYGLTGSQATRGHGYLDTGTESLYNTAAASLGRTDLLLQDVPIPTPGASPAPVPSG